MPTPPRYLCKILIANNLGWTSSAKYSIEMVQTQILTLRRLCSPSGTIEAALLRVRAHNSIPLYSVALRDLPPPWDLRLALPGPLTKFTAGPAFGYMLGVGAPSGIPIAKFVIEIRRNHVRQDLNSTRRFIYPGLKKHQSSPACGNALCRPAHRILCQAV
jgi:hypothetical protein